ncbi:MAG: M14 family metallopeptidase [Microscillaceae bacterium]|nr:M14 family metallopeptidase [Microscillaceae bacterium]
MVKKYLFTLKILCFIVLFHSSAWAQVELSYYLPQDIRYNPKIPTPKSVLGFEVGEWHASHDQLLFYMRSLDAASDRISLQEFARTYEKRPLIMLTITSPENHQKIEQLRAEHLQLCDPGQSGNVDTEKMPLVVNLGYSVHGNEASGANASMLTAYYLAAAEGEKIEALLKNTIILVDPSLNPDGMQRFSGWVNMHRSEYLSTDPNTREFNEVFPGGRTNHYWFDLNRDWLLVQHPESQGRIKKFHEWMPNILTDHHEMGSNGTFFFQPGIPASTHPLTPPQNQELTAEIGKYHAQALDEISSAYFTKEIFDDFYYGKGSTYPDIQGSVGILFEQASARGHARATVNGLLTFPFAIRNHFTVSLSTLAAAQDLRIKLLNYQRDFFRQAPREKGAYIFGSEFDQARNYHLVDVLRRHQIEVRKLKKDFKSDNQVFKAGKAFVVSLDQKQVRLIKAIFQTQTTFQDSIFYDISTWTLPLAFNLPYAKLSVLPDSELIEGFLFPVGKTPDKISKVGYVFQWDGYYTPRALNRIHQKGLLVKVATKQSTVSVESGNLEIDYGTVFVPAGNQKLSPDEIYELMQEIAREDGVDIHSIVTGLASEGVDFGSDQFQQLTKPQVLVLGGEGILSYEVGEIWHLFDQRYQMPISLVDVRRVENLDLNRYNTLVLAGGSYNDLNGRALDKIKNWLTLGNTLIAMGEANNWVNNAGLHQIKFKNMIPKDTTGVLPYVEKNRRRGAQEIGGVIFDAQLDVTHPLGYGFKQNRVPFFKTSNLFAEISKDPYATPLFYAKNPLMSGYISAGNLKLADNTAAILVGHYGRGQLISFLDNPNFRAFWYGTNKLFANAVFFGKNIER